MSDKENGKKMKEENDLELFSREYNNITGLSLNGVSATERPDFIVYRSDGMKLGIELTKVMRDPESAFWARVLNGEEQADSLDSIWKLQELIYNKDKKRSEDNWQLPNRTMLLLQLMDSSIEQLSSVLDDGIIKEINKTGFLEIWIGDYSILEAYGTIQLYCIKPKKWQDLYNHINNEKKPYG
jgi:hypothetical protein